MSQMNPVHTLRVCSFKIYLIFLLSGASYEKQRRKYTLNILNVNIINPLRTKLCLSDLKTHFLPRSKQSASVIKTDKLMLYTEIIAVSSEIHAKHINVLWAEHRISEC